MAAPYYHSTAVIDEGACVGNDTRVWHFSHVCAGAKIGEGCSFGQNTMVANGVIIGNNVKVQNNVAIYTGTEIEDDVFLGPSCVLTNVSNPRSQIVRRGLYERTLIRRGATIGANATIVCGVTLGRYAFVAAGAVVAKDFSDYTLVVGVPGRDEGWMSRHGHRLHFDRLGRATCPESGYEYILQEDQVRCLTLSEEEALPDDLTVGERSYDEFKK